MAFSSATTVTVVMKAVSEALMLDGDNKIQEAYMKYLECVLRICTKLLQDSRQGGTLFNIINKDTMKMVRLGQQCMDRVSTVVNQIDTQSRSVENLPLQKSYKPPGGSKSEPCTPSEQHTKPIPFTQSVFVSKEQSPMEQAYKQNQMLMKAYQARLARLDPRRRMATSLTVQRKMAENLAIAKVQEEASLSRHQLKKKMYERQQRLEEQAARRFGTPVGLTDDDKEQRLIYKQVLEFEQENTEFSDLRTRLEEKPNEPELINKLIQNIISNSDHPLTQKIKRMQARLYSKLQDLVEGKQAFIDQIKVPLSKDLYPDYHWNTHKSVKIENVDISESVEKEEDYDESDKNDEEILDKEDEENGGRVENKPNINKSNNECNDDIVETFDNVQTEVKKDLEKAKDLGEKESKKLREGLRESKGILHQISQEYDSYNQENMDDLFDDEDEEIDEQKNESDDESDFKVSDSDSKTEDEELIVKPSASLSDLKSVEEKIKHLKNESYHRHIKGISEDIHVCMEKMTVLFTICYEQLDCMIGKDQCYACLEKSVFKPIWKYLLGLYRLANEPKELALAYVMTERMACSPGDCNVKAKLQMTDCDEPYDIVIKHLKTLPTQQTLLDKLECLVKCSRLVCQCVEDYYTDKKKVPTIGADDLLPILSYVIIKSGMPQIFSECLILEEFIHEGYIMGEEGYCLTSIQTAVGYLIAQGMES